MAGEIELSTVDDEKAGRHVRQWTSKRKNADLRLDALLDITVLKLYLHDHIGA